MMGIYALPPPQLPAQMNILSIHDLDLAYGARVLFRSLTLGVAQDERIALVGQNGAGKTSLLNLIAKKIQPDSGSIVTPNHLRVAYLPQSVDFTPGQTAQELVSSAIAPRKEAIDTHLELSKQLANALLDPAVRASLVKQQAALQHQIDQLGGWDYQHEVDEMVERLRLPNLLDSPLEDLSGGQKRRIDLARALLTTSDLLLLDEPTNHLDTETVEWLESWLLTRAKALLFVTHDRYFLERIATRILEISKDGELFDHPGNYQAYMERKIERLQIEQTTEDRRQNLLRRELAWLRQGIKARGTRSKQRLSRLNEMRNPENRVVPELDIDIQIADGKSLGSTILEAYGITVVPDTGGAGTGGAGTGEPDATPLLKQTDFVLGKKDRIGIVGPNGCGKTTLIRVLTGDLQPTSGMIQTGARTDIAYLPQDLPELDPNVSVYDSFSDSDYVWIGDQKQHKKQYLNSFLIDYDLQRSSPATLSGGQRRRFELAKIVAKNANVLILDEPTNDLDLTSLQALEEALVAYSGCIIAVSHDRYFLNRICNRIVAFEDRKLEVYEGNYDDYQDKRKEIQELTSARTEVTRGNGVPPTSMEVGGTPPPERGGGGQTYVRGTSPHSSIREGNRGRGRVVAEDRNLTRRRLPLHRTPGANRTP